MKRIIVTLLCVAATLTACGSATKSAAISPCARLSAAQVKVVVGNDTKKPLVTSTGASCSYAAPSSKDNALLVTVQSANSGDFQAEQDAATKGGATVSPLSISDADGFTYSAKNGTVQSAGALLGSTEAEILLIGPSVSEAKAKTALAELLTNLKQPTS